MKTQQLSQLIENENLTSLEKETLQEIINGLYAEPGFSDISVEDISRSIGKSTKVLRGVLSSLIKKDYIFIDNPGTEFQIIYLKKNRYYIHPEWSKDN